MTKKKKMPIGLVARARAAWNRERGGVVLTGKWGRCDAYGNHYRVVVDGGNQCNGRDTWVISRASGGNYSLRDHAMADAVAQVLGVQCGIHEDEIRYRNWNPNWTEIAAKRGWTLYAYEFADTVVLIPDEQAAECAVASYNMWNERNGVS